MHLLTLEKLSKKNIENIIKRGEYFKKNRKTENILKNKNIALIFESPSTRTRISFDIGINELGGHSIILNTENTHVGKKESAKDTAKVLSRYVDCIVARVKNHKTLEEFVRYGSVPVVNSLSNLAHPCQILADLLTIKEHKGTFEGLKLAYFGDGNNVCNSLILGCAIVGIDIFVATPKGYEPNKEFIEKAEKIIKNQNGNNKIVITNDPLICAKNADIVYTDVWVSMSDVNKSLEQIKEIFLPYQLNDKLLEHCNKDYIVMHCLPANRGLEITDNVIDSNNSVIYDQAENRLHIQKAVLEYVLK